MPEIKVVWFDPIDRDVRICKATIWHNRKIYEAEMPVPNDTLNGFDTDQRLEFMASIESSVKSMLKKFKELPI